MEHIHNLSDKTTRKVTYNSVGIKIFDREVQNLRSNTQINGKGSDNLLYISKK